MSFVIYISDTFYGRLGWDKSKIDKIVSFNLSFGPILAVQKLSTTPSIIVCVSYIIK